jgi:hypothetical protein
MAQGEGAAGTQESRGFVFIVHMWKELGLWHVVEGKLKDQNGEPEGGVNGSR